MLVQKRISPQPLYSMPNNYRGTALTDLFCVVVIVLSVFQDSSVALAESLSRSEAQTPGEKRLLEWDLSKSYDLSSNKPPQKGKAPKSSFSTQPFLAGSFKSKSFTNNVLSKTSFSSPEFLIPGGEPRTKTFSYKPALPPEPAKVAKPFVTVEAPYAPPKVVPAFPSEASSAPKAFAGGYRPFQGQEAARKEQSYVPGNAPKGGTIEGRRLTVDEVKEILNRSK